MRTISYKLDDLKKTVIKIGYVGENRHTQVRLDCTDLFKEYPDAAVSMAIVSPAGQSYPKVVTVDGSTVVWDVTDSDLAAEGDGEIQLTFTEGGVVAKTADGRFTVYRSITAEGPAPDPVDDWMQEASEALEDIEAAEVNQPIIGQDGYWYTWDQEAGEYVKTNTKAQGEDGQPGHTPEKGVDYWTAADKAEMESDVAGAIIDDTSTALDKTWSASKSNTLLSEIQEKYTKPNTGIPSTDLAQAVQTSLGKADSAYQKPQTGIPASDMAEGVIPTVPAIATSAQIKTGTDSTHPIAPNRQNESVFYGLAKLAGADMASSSNPVGQFTDDAIVKIQKMLGVYQSPWELIREDTVTNATEADVDITVDGDGESFELTDVYLQVWTPQQETNASIGDYGSVRCFYNDNNSIGTQMGTWTQSANTSAKYGQILLTNENGAIRNEATQNATQYTLVYLTSRTNIISDDALLKIGTYSFKKITIKKVTGTMKYKLYGRRKWN